MIRSFAFKIGLAVNLTLVPIVGFAGWFFYSNTYTTVLGLMTDRLKDVVRTGSFLFDKAERKKIERLRSQVLNDPARRPVDKKIRGLAPGDYASSLPKAKEKKYMAQKDFKSIVQKLRTMKEASRKKLKRLGFLKQLSPEEADYPLIQYAYVLIALPEVPDKSLQMFLADADYQPMGEEEGNPIGNIYKVKQTSFIDAFDGKVSSEDKFVSDEWGTWLSGAAPIINEKKQVIAILGIDYDAASEANKLSTLFYTILLVTSVSLILGIFISILVAKFLSKPINQLRLGAEKVAHRNFDAQIHVKNKDELGLLADSFNFMVREVKNYSNEMENLNEVYFRFVPKSFLDNLGLVNVTDIKLGDQVQKNMTVLFSDIRSFTAMTETMEPESVFNFINSYLNVVGPIIRHHHGFIDKYIGDAIMALFPRSPVDALHAATAMRIALNEFNQKREQNSQTAIDMGIGINSGNLMLGTVGEKERMETTVFADAVNTASRLESYTKKFYAPIIISDKTQKAVESQAAAELAAEFPMRYLGRLQVRGKKEPVGIYQLFVNVDDNLELKKKTETDFAQGIQLFMRRQYEHAAVSFENVCLEDPNDRTAAFYLEQCQTLKNAA